MTLQTMQCYWIQDTNILGRFLISDVLLTQQRGDFIFSEAIHIIKIYTGRKG